MTAVRRGRAGLVTTVALGLWGAVHLVGGATLLPLSGADGLDSLAPNATSTPADPGEAAAAVMHFHGFNIAVAGLAVLVLAVLWRRSGRTWQLGVATGLAVVLDVGLVLYLVGPGLLPPSQGLPGLGLLAVALVAMTVGARTRAGEPSERTPTPI